MSSCTAEYQLLSGSFRSIRPVMKNIATQSFSSPLFKSSDVRYGLWIRGGMLSVIHVHGTRYFVLTTRCFGPNRAFSLVIKLIMRDECQRTINSGEKCTCDMT